MRHVRGIEYAHEDERMSMHTGDLLTKAGALVALGSMVVSDDGTATVADRHAHKEVFHRVRSITTHSGQAFRATHRGALDAIAAHVRWGLVEIDALLRDWRAAFLGVLLECFAAAVQSPTAEVLEKAESVWGCLVWGCLAHLLTDHATVKSLVDGYEN